MKLAPVTSLLTSATKLALVAGLQPDFQSKTEHDCPDAGPCVKCCGRRIRQRREALGLKQAGVSRSHWEYGWCFPSVAELYYLAPALKCSTDWLLRGTNPPHDMPREVVNRLGRKARA